MKTEAERICELACRVGLWAEPEAFAVLQAYRDLVGNDNELSAEGFLDFLVRSHRLTRYQAKCLMQGGKGLIYAEHFLISSPRGSSESSGASWDAIHRQSSHPVVLHVFKREQRESAYFLLMRGTVISPGLAKVYGGMSRGDVDSVVEERPPGGGLARLLRSSGSVSIDRACSIALDVAKTLVDLHARGLGQGGVSPDDIVVQDSGRAVLMSGVGTKRGASMPDGTTLSPVAPDLHADVRSLGQLIYAMVGGRPPAMAASTPSTAEGGEVANVTSLDTFTEAPLRLADLVRRLMEHSRERPLVDLRATILELQAFMPPGWRESPRMTEPSEEAFLQGASPLMTIRYDGASSGIPGEPTDRRSMHGTQRVTSQGSVQGGTSISSQIAHEPSAHRQQRSAESIRIAVEHSRRTADRGRTARSTKSRALWTLLLSMIAILIAFMGYRLSRSQPRAFPSESSMQVVESPAEVGRASRNQETSSDGAGKSSHSEQVLVPPSGTTLAKQSSALLWESPSQGRAITFLRIPDGAQGVLWLRPITILAEPDAKATLESLGPDVRQVLVDLLRPLHLSLEDVEELLIAFTPRDAESPEVCLNLRVTDVGRNNATPHLRNAQDGERGLQGSVSDWSVWFPADSPQWMIATSEAAMVRLMEEDRPPLLRRQLEALRRVSDNQWTLACFFAPSFLAADGESLWVGGLRQLREPLLRFCGDSAQAVGVGCFLGSGVFYLETRLVYSGAESVTAKVLETPGRLDQLWEDAKRSVSESTHSPFWRPLAARFPEMLDIVRDWTRVGSDEVGMVINLALPSVAARNLFMGTELALVESLSMPDSTGKSGGEGTIAGVSAEAALELPLSLVVKQQSLEAVIEEVAAAVRDRHAQAGFGIDVRGKDLQLDGITRNQQLRGIDLQDRPLREVLTEVVRLGNPMRVASVKMPEQKLVWVVAPVGGNGASPQVVITTRAAAAKNGWKLPPEFLE